MKYKVTVKDKEYFITANTDLALRMKVNKLREKHCIPDGDEESVIVEEVNEPDD